VPVGHSPVGHLPAALFCIFYFALDGSAHLGYNSAIEY
jgi:hypothetical protein